MTIFIADPLTALRVLNIHICLPSRINQQQQQNAWIVFFITSMAWILSDYIVPI